MNVGLRAGRVKETGFSLHIAELMSRFQQKVNSFHISRAEIAGASFILAFLFGSDQEESLGCGLLALAFLIIAIVCMCTINKEGGEG